MLGVKALPPELLLSVFWFLDARLILDASHVCSVWREIALGHPFFWSHVQLTSIEHGNLQLALFRIDMGRARPFRLDISLPGADERIPGAIFPIILRCLPSLRQLEITLSENFIERLWDTLRRPAPELLSLRVAAELGSESGLTHLPLPSDLFLGDARRLREVQLRQVALPDYDVPAFVHVLAVIVVFLPETSQDFPAFLFRCFPSMHRLHLAGGTINFDAPVPPLAAHSLARLQYMDLEYGDEIANFLGHPAAAALPVLSIAFATPPAVQAALTGLQHPLQLSMSLYRGSEFHISVTSADGRRRIFAENPADYEDDEAEPNSILQDAELAASRAFGTLLISTALWEMIHPYLPTFGHLVILVVWIEDATCDTVELPAQLVSCPKLETLALCSKHQFSYVDADELSLFIDGITSNIVELELVRVLLVGPTESLSRRVVRINTQNAPSLIWWPEKNGIDW